MATQTELEPARFSMTGGGFLLRLREGFEAEEWPGHFLDAPSHVPQGSVRAASEVVCGAIGMFTSIRREEVL